MDSVFINLLQILAGFAGGFVGAITGGGGLLLLPVLLLSGASTTTVLGTNKMLSVFTTLPSAIVYARKLKINIRQWYTSIIFTIIGAITSVFIVSSIPQGILNYTLIFLLIVTTLHTFYCDFKKSKQYQINKKINDSIKNMTCFFVSCFSGIAGAGGGLLWTNVLVSLYKLEIIMASGIARILSLVSNLIAFILFIRFGFVDFKLGLLIGLSVLLGSYFGAHTGIHMNKTATKIIILLVLIFTCLTLLFNK